MDNTSATPKADGSLPTLSIPKDEVARMPTVIYPGDIVVVDTPEGAEAAVDALLRVDALGFDTETRPSFRKGEVNKVALMQVADDSTCYLFRLNKIGFLPCLKQLMEAEQPLKIGLSIKDDFHVMQRSDDTCEPRGFVDLQDYVKRWGIADCSLQKIWAIVMGGRISKGQRLSNWEAQELSHGQQAYASLDAWACLKLWRELTDGRFDPWQSPWKVQP